MATPVPANPRVLPDWLPGAELVIDSGDGTSVLHCIEKIREIPGRRVVYRANWRGQPVYAKLYRTSSDGRRHWAREVSGLQALAKNNIPAPVILYQGTAAGGGVLAVLLAPVENPVSVRDAWDRCETDNERRRLMEAVVRTLARQHQAGIRQQDAHLDNFLISADVVVSLDGGDVRCQAGPLSEKASLANLGLLFAQVGQPHDALLLSTLPVYLGIRGWPAGPDMESRLGLAIRRMRRKRRDRYLKKVFRDCTAFAVRQDLRRREIFDRKYRSPAFEHFLQDPDTSLADGELLKAGNTCTVWRTVIDGHDLVVKRYNIKGMLHGLGRAWRPTRAAVSWRNAHRLGLYGIQTAPPVALVEQRLGPLRNRAWLITGRVEGRDSLAYMMDASVPVAEKAESATRIAALVASLRDHRISHGDMKGTNIVLTAAGPVLIDLDAMHEHGNETRFQRRHRRDLQRLMKNWPAESVAARLMADALATHGLGVAPDQRTE